MTVEAIMWWNTAMFRAMVASTVSFIVPLYDLLWSAVALVPLAVMIVGLVSLARRSWKMPGLESFMWIAVVIALPILGTVLWFAVGRRRYPKNAHAPASQQAAVD